MFAFDLQRRNVILNLSIGEIPWSKKKYVEKVEFFQHWEWDALKPLTFVSDIMVFNYQKNEAFGEAIKTHHLKAH